MKNNCSGTKIHQLKKNILIRETLNIIRPGFLTCANDKEKSNQKIINDKRFLFNKI